MTADIREYLVEWAINISGTSPYDAAMEAWDTMRGDDSIANVFDVHLEHGMRVQVDLTEGIVTEEPRWVPDHTQLADLAEWMHNDDWDIDEILNMLRRPRQYADQFSEMLREREYGKVAKEPEEIDDSEEAVDE